MQKPMSLLKSMDK